HPWSEPVEQNADKIKDDLRLEETVRKAYKKDQASGISEAGAGAGAKENIYRPDDHAAEERKMDDNKINAARKKEYRAYKKSVLPLADEKTSVLAFQRPVREKKNIGKHAYAENIGAAITAEKQIMPFMRIAKVTVPGDTRISAAGSISMKDVVFLQLQLPETGLSAIDLSKRKKPFHFSIMPFFSPQFNFNRIEDDDDHRGGSSGRRESEEIKRDEKHQASSSWGILVEAPLKKNWSLQTGLTYTIKNIDIEPKKIFAQLDNDGEVKYCFNLSSGYAYLSPKTTAQPIVGDSITAAETSSNLRYLSIPVTLQYTLYKGKFSIIPSIGGGINFLVSQRIKTNLLSGSSEERQDISDIQGLKKIYYNTISGIAIQYPIGKYVSLNIAPSVNFALGTINSDAAVKSYPNSFNIATGIRIQL
ncbi:MAG: outer membrane beta-barrel protein, partial [Flavitalea sp.]